MPALDPTPEERHERYIAHLQRRRTVIEVEKLLGAVGVKRCRCGLANPGPEHRAHYPMLCSEEPPR